MNQNIVRKKAVAIDTSILRKYNFQFESGLLKKLIELNTSGTQILITDIVFWESVKQVKMQIEKSIQEYQSLQKVMKYTPYLVNELIGVNSDISNDVTVNVQDIALKRFQKYVDQINATLIVSSKYSDFQSIITDYFNNSPPFSKEGKKKSEFPDAISLDSIMQYSKLHNLHTTMVSNDEDWRSYCGTHESSLVLFEDNLGKVIEDIKINSATSNIFELVIEDSNNENSRLIKYIDEIVYEIIDKLDIKVDYYSSFQIEHESTYCYVDKFEIVKNKIGKIELLLIESNEQEIQVQVEVKVDYIVNARFNLIAYDPVDKENIVLDEGNCSVKAKFESGILISISRDNEASEFEFEKYEILERTDAAVSMGNVDPNFYNIRTT